MHIFKTLALALGLTASALSMTIDTGVEMENTLSAMTMRPVRCLASYIVRPGDTCMLIMEQHPHTMTLEQLLAWNPSIQDDCRNLQPHQTICIRARTMSDCPSASSTMAQPTTMTMN